jgi:hypothetical protein
MTAATDGAVRVGGDEGCPHDSLSFLGQMGPNAMYACEHCGGVLVVAPG